MSAAGGLPTWRQLATELVSELDSTDPSRSAYLAQFRTEAEHLVQQGRLVDALSAVRSAMGHAEFALRLEGACSDSRLAVPRTFAALAALAPQLRGIITTNLDRFIERALPDWTPHASPKLDVLRRPKSIVKLHGTIQERASWVFARDQYDRSMFDSTSARTTFKAIYLAHPILFLGCSLKDDDLDMYFGEIRSMANEHPPAHFAIVEEPIGPQQRKQLEAAGIRLLTYPNGHHQRLVDILHAIP